MGDKDEELEGGIQGYGKYLSELVRRGGEPCKNAGLHPLEEGDLSEGPGSWKAYLATAKLSQKMKSMADASISCYASAVIADTEWCEFWLYGGGQEGLSAALNWMADPAQCDTVCADLGIVPFETIAEDPLAVGQSDDSDGVTPSL